MALNKSFIDTVMNFYKKKGVGAFFCVDFLEKENEEFRFTVEFPQESLNPQGRVQGGMITSVLDCLLYTSPSPRDATLSRMPSSA